MSYKRLGDTIRETRERLGLSRDDVADRKGPSIGTLGQIETGKRKDPQFSSVVLAADAMGITLDDLKDAQSKVNSLGRLLDAAVFLSKLSSAPPQIQKAVLMLVHKDAAYVAGLPDSVVRDATKLLKSLVAL